MDERVIGCDLYNFLVTGNIACNLNASSCNSPTHSGPSLLIEKSYTLDCRNIEMNEEKSGTLQAKENGGYSLNYTNPVLIEKQKLRRGGCWTIGKQFTTAHDTAVTLEATDHKDPMIVCYGISAFESNAMKSNNPHSGIYEAKTARTLDLNCCNPACNQGGGGSSGEKT